MTSTSIRRWIKQYREYGNRRLIKNRHSTIGGQDYNPLTNFDIKRFGKNHVIGIPSTLSGSIFI